MCSTLDCWTIGFGNVGHKSLRLEPKGSANLGLRLLIWGDVRAVSKSQHPPRYLHGGPYGLYVRVLPVSLKGQWRALSSILPPHPIKAPQIPSVLVSLT